MGTLPLFEKPSPKAKDPKAKSAASKPAVKNDGKVVAKPTQTTKSTKAGANKRPTVVRTSFRIGVAPLIAGLRWTASRGARLAQPLTVRLVALLRRRAPLIAAALFVLFALWRISGAAMPSRLASLFTPEVQHWGAQILDWADQYGIDPNLIATIMQIESCGLAEAVSNAGAQGLFQVMPSNFAPTITDQLAPAANAEAGLGVLKDCLRWANNDTAGALACYNGGPSLIKRPSSSWPDETQRYVAWGTGIYNDAMAHAGSSSTLTNWLNMGGVRLCDRAAVALDLSPHIPTLPTLIAPPTRVAPPADGQPYFPPTVSPR